MEHGKLKCNKTFFLAYYSLIVWVVRDFIFKAVMKLLPPWVNGRDLSNMTSKSDVKKKHLNTVQ